MAGPAPGKAGGLTTWEQDQAHGGTWCRALIFETQPAPPSSQSVPKRNSDGRQIRLTFFQEKMELVKG